VNRSELVEAIAQHGDVDVPPKGVDAVLRAFIETVGSTLSKGEKVSLVGFGTFEPRQRAARTGRNPQDPTKTVKIKAATVPAFKAGQGLKEVVAGKKKATAKKASSSKATAKKATGAAKAGAAKAGAAKKATASKATASKAAGKKATASKASASKATASKATASRAAGKKATGKKAAAKKAAKR
jgi:DNA-binding protein HU-beta